MPLNQLSEKYAQTMRFPASCSKARMRCDVTQSSSGQKSGKAAW